METLPIRKHISLTMNFGDSEELQDIYKEIKKIRQSVKDISGFSFKPFFEERLLDKIKYEDKQNVLITGLLILL